MKNCMGQHPFKEIFSQRVGSDEYFVIRWCPVCGAIVQDLDFDGRTHPGYYKECELPQNAQN